MATLAHTHVYMDVHLCMIMSVCVRERERERVSEQTSMLSYVPQLHNTELCSIRHPSYTTAKSVSALSPKRSSELPEVASTLGTSSSTGPAKEVDRLNRPPLGLPCSKDNTS